MQKTDRDELLRLIGRSEAFRSIEGMSRIARVHALKRIRDEKLYKGVPGCNTMRDVFAMIGVSKTTGYEELDALERLGGSVMELICEMGVSTHDALLLGRGVSGEVEDFGFEVLDAEAGMVRVGGKELRVQDEPDLVTHAITRAINLLRMHSSANKGLQADLDKEKEERKKLAAKVEKGEEQMRRLQKDLARKASPLDETTAVARAILALGDQVKQVCAMDLTEDDEKARWRYTQLIANIITNPLTAKFNPRGEDLYESACNMAGQNEYLQERDRIDGFDD